MTCKCSTKVNCHCWTLTDVIFSRKKVHLEQKVGWLDLYWLWVCAFLRSIVFPSFILSQSKGNEPSMDYSWWHWRLSKTRWSTRLYLAEVAVESISSEFKQRLILFMYIYFKTLTIIQFVKLTFLYYAQIFGATLKIEYSVLKFTSYFRNGLNFFFLNIPCWYFLLLGLSKNAKFFVVAVICLHHNVSCSMWL